MARSVKRSRSKKSVKKNNAAVQVKGKKSKKTGGKLGPVLLEEDNLDKNRFYCVKCRAKCFSRKPDIKVGTTKKGRSMLKGKCKTCGTKVNRFFS